MPAAAATTKSRQSRPALCDPIDGTLAPHERLPEILVVPREKTPTGAQVLSLGREDPLMKEMATHSSILAWEIPWMEEPDRLLLSPP